MAEFRLAKMAHGDAATDDAPEELLPEEVATAQTTHRRPKVQAPVPASDVQMSDFLEPPPASQPATSQPASDPYLGRVIAERYYVERLLGVGSMGLVYRCRHTVLDKTVALKIIRQDLAQDAETVGRFVTEARAASAIGSKHIVEVLDFGNLPDGASYIVMEYLEGLTLGEALDAPGGLSVGDAIDISIQITMALGAAHAIGVVHRDLKPDNVFLVQGPNGWFTKILDFGIAKVMHGGQKLTAVGSVIGTPHYMSPEQATGARTDERTDIYSLGVMLYEMCCGKVPFDAENPLAVIAMQVTDEPPSVKKRMPEGRTLPQGLDLVVHKCLAKDPHDRFSTMEDVRAALERIAGGGVPLVVPPSSRDTTSDSFIEDLRQDTDFRELHASGRRRAWIGRAALGALAVVVGIGAYFLLQPQLTRIGAKAKQIQAAAVAPVDEAPSAVATAAAAPAPSPTTSAAPVPSAAAAPAADLVHVALILFPLNSHVFDGDKDLGMMPISIDVAPGESKMVSVVRKGYVTRHLKVDGSKTRVVVGLVSDAAAAKHKGLSQAEAEAEADRAAAHLAADDATDEATLPADGDTADASGGALKAGTKAKAGTKTDRAAADAPKPTRSGAKTPLAPNPFGD